MRNLILINILIVVFSCSEQRKEKVVTGNWFYFDSDSAYNELYFSNELFVYNLDGAILGSVYFYATVNDSIYIQSSFENSQKEFLFKILSAQEDQIHLVNQKGNKIILLPIEEELDVWSSINLGEKTNSELIKGWYNRHHLKKYGSSANTDDLLTVPPVEQYDGDTIVH